MWSPAVRMCAWKIRMISKSAKRLAQDQRITMLECYIVRKSYNHCVKICREKFLDVVIPGKITVYDVIEHFYYTGIFMDRSMKQSSIHVNIRVYRQY